MSKWETWWDLWWNFVAPFLDSFEQSFSIETDLFSWPGSIKTFQRRYYAMLVFKHSDWLLKYFQRIRMLTNQSRVNLRWKILYRIESRFYSLAWPLENSESLLNVGSSSLFLKKMCQSRPRFLYFRLFYTIDSKRSIIFCWWLDSNRGPQYGSDLSTNWAPTTAMGWSESLTRKIFRLIEWCHTTVGSCEDQTQNDSFIFKNNSNE